MGSFCSEKCFGFLGDLALELDFFYFSLKPKILKRARHKLNF